MSQIKIQVLSIGELQSGKSSGSNPREWFRRSLQCFTGQVVGNIPYYAEKDELEAMNAGEYMFNLEARAGDRGRLEYVLGSAQSVTRPQAKPQGQLA